MHILIHGLHKSHKSHRTWQQKQRLHPPTGVLQECCSLKENVTTCHTSHTWAWETARGSQQYLQSHGSSTRHTLLHKPAGPSTQPLLGVPLSKHAHTDTHPASLPNHKCKGRRACLQRATSTFARRRQQHLAYSKRRPLH
jgi:hypothetical protein